jgi:hypothetical protein
VTRWVTIDAVADAAYAAEFRGEALAIAIAVTKPESGIGAPAGMWADAEALGDTTITTEKWGPSVGAWQVRTVNAERGKGSTRDRSALFGNLAKQAKSAYTIAGGNVTTGSWGKGGNKGWGHWSVFQLGLHRRYLDEARAAARRREGLGGSGAIGGGGTGGGDEDVSHDVVIPSGELPVAVRAPRTAADLVFIGTGRDRPNLDGWLLDGELDFSLDEASELSLTVLNADHYFVGSGGGLNTRSVVEWAGLRFNVSAAETSPGVGEPRALYSCRDIYVDLLKRTNVDAAGKASGDTPRGVIVAGKTISPTEYASIQARGVGLRFMGEGSARRTDIAPEKGDDGIYESPWEVLNRLADELGYLVFVSGDVLYFGRPTWLAERATTVRVGLTRGAWGDEALDTIGEPTWRETVDSFDGAELTVDLPRWRGEAVRPGMKLVTKGLYGLGASEWLVHRVTWPVDDGRGPVTVEAREPVNPLVKAREGNTPPVEAGGQAGATDPAPKAGDSGYVWPARGTVTSKFRPANRPTHEGLDIANTTGTPINAAKAGTVSRSAVSSSYGEVIYIDHHDGTETRYAHLSRRRARNGEKVTAGQRIGDMGSTGRSTGPHLHFEVRRNPPLTNLGAVDPLTVLP